MLAPMDIKNALGISNASICASYLGNTISSSINLIIFYKDTKFRCIAGKIFHTPLDGTQNRCKKWLDPKIQGV